MAQPQPGFVNIQVAPPQTNPVGYKKGWQGRLTTGIIQILCGVALIVLGVWGAFIVFAFLSPTVWGGVFIIIAGSLGAASCGHYKCPAIAYLVLSIIAALWALGLLIWEISILSATNSQDDGDWWVIYEVHVGAAVVAGIAIIMAIIGSAFSCYGACSSTPQNSQVIQYQSQAGPNMMAQGAYYPPPAYNAPAAQPYMQARY